MAIIGIISRAPFVLSERGMFFQNTDGPYLDGLACHFKMMVLVTTILRKGYHAAYDILPKYTYKFAASNIEVVEVPFTRARNPGVIHTATGLMRSIPVMWKAIQKCDLNAIFLPGMRSVIASLICRLLRKPYWVYLGSNWSGIAPTTFRWSGWRRRYLFDIYTRFVDFCERWVMRKAFFRLVTGKSLLLKHRYPDNATYLTRPLITLSGKDLYEREDTCQGETIYLLCVGNLNPRKGHRYLIEALSFLHAWRKSSKLTIVGEGSERANLEALVDQMGLRPFVHFAGYVPNGPELWMYYRNADIFVLPTLGEGLPRVIFEAMSQGLPVICSDVSGISEQFVHGKHLLLVPPRKPGEIAEALAVLFRNPALRQKLIQNGLSIARETVKVSAISQTVSIIQQHILGPTRI